jgi:hypothetical protein
LTLTDMIRAPMCWYPPNDIGLLREKQTVGGARTLFTGTMTSDVDWCACRGAAAAAQPISRRQQGRAGHREVQRKPASYTPVALHPAICSSEREQTGLQNLQQRIAQHTLFTLPHTGYFFWIGPLLPQLCNVVTVGSSRNSPLTFLIEPQSKCVAGGRRLFLRGLGKFSLFGTEVNNRSELDPLTRLTLGLHFTWPKNC